MPKSKTRFVINVDGTPKDLLAIREQSTGDLRLLIRSAEFYTGEGPRDQRIKNQYYSLHRSLSSAGNSFKQTIELENGYVVDTMHTSFGIDAGRFALLFSALPAKLSLQRYDAPIRLKDTVISLGDMNSQTGNIVWAVLVSRPDTGFHTKQPFINVTFAQFRHFRVTLAWSFIGIRATENGGKLHNLTSAPRHNRDGRSSLPVASADEWRADEAEVYISASMKALLRRAIDFADNSSPFNSAFLTRAADLKPTPY